MGEGRREGGDRGAPDQPTDPTGRRLTVPEAARTLGISADAVRSRIKRGTLATEREGGRVFVVLGASFATDRARPTNAQAASDQPTDHAAGDDLLRQQMQARIDDLREQLRREQEEPRLPAAPMKWLCVTPELELLEWLESLGAAVPRGGIRPDGGDQA